MAETKDRNEVDLKTNGAETPPKVDSTAGLDADRTYQTCGVQQQLVCRKPTPPRRKAQVCNNRGFSRGQELSD